VWSRPHWREINIFSPLLRGVCFKFYIHLTIRNKGKLNEGELGFLGEDIGKRRGITGRIFLVFGGFVVEIANLDCGRCHKLHSFNNILFAKFVTLLKGT